MARVTVKTRRVRYTGPEDHQRGIHTAYLPNPDSKLGRDDAGNYKEKREAVFMKGRADVSEETARMLRDMKVAK